MRELIRDARRRLWMGLLAIASCFILIGISRSGSILTCVVVWVGTLLAAAQGWQYLRMTRDLARRMSANGEEDLSSGVDARTRSH